MPIYEVEHNGQTYEVDAPDPGTAARALTRGRETVPGEVRFPSGGQAPAPAAAPTPAAPGPGITTGHDPRAQYLLDWGKGVYDSIVNRNPHEDLAQVGGLPAGIDAAASLASTFVSPLLGPAHALDMRANGAPDYTFRQGKEDRTIDPKTAGGAQLLDTAGAVFKPAVDVLHAAGNVVRGTAGYFGASPQLQEDLGFLTEETLPAAAGGVGMVKGFRGIPKDIPPPPGAPGAGGRTVQEIRAAGYPVTPSFAARAAQRESPRNVMPSVPGTFRESLVNRGELGSRMGVESAKVTERILRDEFGIPDGVPLTKELLENEARGANAAYDMAAQAAPTVTYTPTVRAAIDQLGAIRRNNPNLGALPEVERLRMRLSEIESAPTQQVLDAIREFRSDARAYFQSPGADPVVSAQLAKAYRGAADALENGVAQALEATGNQHIFSQFQAARVLQAKINNVLDAWNGLEVDPQALARLGQDVKLTGGLAQIANAATHMPETVFATTGDSIVRPSNASWINTPESGLRRFLFEKWVIPKLLSDEFQNQFGTAAPRSPNPRFQVEGPIGDPNVGPPVPPPPPGGRYPWSPAGEDPSMMALVPDEGGVPFTGTQLPPVGGDTFGLADQVVPDLFRGADTSAAGGLSLADGPLTENLGSGVGVERYPFTPTQTAPPGLQPGASVGLADQLMPEPAGSVNMPPEGPGRGTVVPPSAGFNPLGEWISGLLERLGEPNSPRPVEGEWLGGKGSTGRRKQPFGFNNVDDLIPEADRVTHGPLSLEGPKKPMGPEDFPDAESGVPVEPNKPAPSGPSELGDALTMEEGPARTEAPDISLAPPTAALPKPSGKTPSGLDIYDNVEPNVLKGMTTRKGDTVLQGDGRTVILEPVGKNSMAMRWTVVEEGKRGAGLGRQQTIDAVRLANKRGRTLESDESLTAAQIGVLKSLFRDGIIRAGREPDWAAIDAAAERNGGIAKNTSGESWIKGIRLGPNAE